MTPESLAWLTGGDYWPGALLFAYLVFCVLCVAWLAELAERDY